MTHLVFPEHVTVTIRMQSDLRSLLRKGSSLVFGVRTFARTKVDYRLGPFFSDEEGKLAITRRQLELHARAQLSTGLMDYAPIGDAFPLVEIVHWTADEVRRSIDARATLWKNLLDGEEELFGSVGALLERLRAAGNHLVQPTRDNCGRLRDEWADGAPRQYEYMVSRA